jgi:hypothetical protein
MTFPRIKQHEEPPALQVALSLFFGFNPEPGGYFIASYSK